MEQPLVSIAIPTYNNADVLPACLASIRSQTYPNIEAIVVDGWSADDTVHIAQQAGVTTYRYGPDQRKRKIFGAPYQRNYGVAKSHGEIVYYMDADMELTPNVIASIAELIQNGADAVIVPEDSFGTGFWAKCKQLERRCYWGDDTVEAARAFKKSVWEKLGGLDVEVGSGGDDWDLQRRAREAGYRIVRTPEIVRHNEGHLTLQRLWRKRLLYGQRVHRYVAKQGSGYAARQFSPFRPAYFRNWRRFVADPIHGFGFIIMRLVEYTGGAVGLVLGIIKPAEVKLDEIIMRTEE